MVAIRHCRKTNAASLALALAVFWCAPPLCAVQAASADSGCILDNCADKRPPSDDSGLGFRICCAARRQCEGAALAPQATSIFMFLRSRGRQVFARLPQRRGLVVNAISAPISALLFTDSGRNMSMATLRTAPALIAVALRLAGCGRTLSR